MVSVTVTTRASNVRWRWGSFELTTLFLKREQKLCGASLNAGHSSMNHPLLCHISLPIAAPNINITHVSLRQDAGAKWLRLSLS
jgi:hypothetical protein